MRKAELEGNYTQKKIDQFLLMYRNTPHAFTGQAPSMLLKGYMLRTRLDAMKPTNHLNKKNFMKKEDNGRNVCFEVDEPVLIRNYQGKLKWRNGVIKKKLGPLSYEVLN